MKLKNNERLPNDVVLDSFLRYCLEHPEQRFWQQLRNWSGAKFVLVAEDYDLENNYWKGVRDTFFFNGKFTKHGYTTRSGRPRSRPNTESTR